MVFLNTLLEKSECSVCSETKNGFQLHLIYDGKICQRCLKKVGFDGDIKTLSVLSCQQRCSLYDQLNKTGSKMPPYPYISIDDYEMACRRDSYVFTAKYTKLNDLYYDDMNKIETLWSVLYNLKEFNDSKATSFETKCIKNINTFKEIYETYCIPYNTIEFNCVPAYKRLAMLYEKQGRFEEAVMICIDAIKHHVPNEYGDGGSGKMYARLARMAKKAKMLNTQEVQKYIK